MATKNCVQCGQPVRVVPAGISKKTNKPYGSFAKCEACGFSEQIGQQPPRQKRETPHNTQALEEILAVVRENNKILRQLGSVPEDPFN